METGNEAEHGILSTCFVYWTMSVISHHDIYEQRQKCFNVLIRNQFTGSYLLLSNWNMEKKLTMEGGLKYEMYG